MSLFASSARPGGCRALPAQSDSGRRCRLRSWRLGILQHVFQPIGAVGHAHVDPLQLVAAAALPAFDKAENVAEETVFLGAIVHDESRMENDLRNRLRSVF